LYERLKLAATPRPHNLPPQTTPFVGREAELARITNYLENPDCRLLTLTGLGGVGKTRLALQAAAASLSLFQDGVFFVSLTTINSLEGLISTITNALDFPLSGTLEDKLQLLNYLRPKEMLLILDNFEQLLPLSPSTNGGNRGGATGKRGAGGEAVAGEILKAAPKVKLLVTSRERLNLQEEWLLEIEGLTFPERDWSASNPPALELYSAVDFFIQQARRVQADFALAATNQADVARLCHLLQGMPLGLELAATWLPILSPAEIMAEIERDLDFLTTSTWNIPDRHRSIRAVFESSWHLLSGLEREVLQGLSVFRGGFSREAAVQVTGASFSLLLGLLNKSLLGRDALGRYDMHELIRQYAAEKLAEKEEAVAAQRTRLAAYYLALAEQAEPELRGPNQMAWWQRLEIELDNLRAALAWAVETCQPEIGLRLVAALGWFWRIRGHLTEGRDWSARILVLPCAQAQSAFRAKALNAAGLLAFYQTDYPVARALYEESMAISEAAGDQASLAQTLHGLGNTLWYQGHSARAVSLLEQSFTIFCELEDQPEVAAVLSRLGAVAAFQGDAEAARSLLERSLAIYKTLDDKWGIVYALWSLADAVYYSLQDYETGAALYEQGLSLAREVRDKPVLLSILVSLADAALVRQDYGQLEAYAREALLLAKELGDQWQPPRMLRLLGYAALQGEDKAQATVLFLESLHLNYKLDDRRGLLACLAALARLAHLQQQSEMAVQWLSAIQTLLASKKERLLPADSVSYERILALIQTEVPSEQFTRSWEQGQKISLEPLIQQAEAKYRAARSTSNY
jgi:predicted ATPase